MELRVGRLGLLIALAVAGIEARAEPPTERAALDTELDRAAARGLADRGYELYEAGLYEQARSHFHQANQRYQAPTLLLMIARCHERLGQLRRAFEIYRGVALYEPPPDAPEPFLEARAAASDAVVAIQKRMPAVRVVILGHYRKDAWIMVDDIAVSSGELMPLDVGVHVINADVHGLPTARTQVELAGTAKKVVEITLGTHPKIVTRVEGGGDDPPAAAKHTAARAQARPEGETPRPVRAAVPSPATASARLDGRTTGAPVSFKPSPIVLGVGIGATVVLTGTAAVLAGLGVAKGETADELCPSSCRDTAMRDAWRDAEASRVGLLNTSSWLFIGAGAAGLATAMVGLVWPSLAESAPARTGLRVAVPGTGVVISARW